MFERWISAVEAAEQIMKEWSDSENKAIGKVISSPVNVDWLKDEEEVQDNDIVIDNGLPSDAEGMVQVQTHFLNKEEKDDEVENNDNDKEE